MHIAVAFLQLLSHVQHTQAYCIHVCSIMTVSHRVYASISLVLSSDAWPLCQWRWHHCLCVHCPLLQLCQ